MTWITVATGLMDLLELAFQKINAARAAGEVSAEDQQKAVDRLNKLRSGEAFAGDEWKKS